MNINRITVRYAKALLSAAIELGVAHIVDKDITFVASKFNQADFKMFLENPTIRTSVKINVFREVFADKVNPLTIKFLELLTLNKRELYLSRIALNYSTTYRKSFNITQVQITTAVNVGEILKNEVSNTVSKTLNTTVELKETVEPEIIGGFIINIDDKQYDASIKNKLEKVKRELLQIK